MAIPCRVFSYSMKPCALEIGGRYQNDHASFSVCGWDWVAEEEKAALVSEMDAMLGALATALGNSLGWPALETAVFRAESKGLAPGVLGVFPEPKDAKAPEPRPKALEAPLVGETRAPGVLGSNGLALP